MLYLSMQIQEIHALKGRMSYSWTLWMYVLGALSLQGRLSGYVLKIPISF